MGYRVEQRNTEFVNTDPQRRCYNGAHASTAEQWAPWLVWTSGLDTLAEAEKEVADWSAFFDMPPKSGRKYEFRIVEEDEPYEQP